jgi:hypothetical protein
MIIIRTEIRDRDETMVGLTDLDEWFDLAPECKFLLTHTPSNFPRISLDANNDSVGVRPLLGSFI